MAVWINLNHRAEGGVGSLARRFSDRIQIRHVIAVGSIVLLVYLVVIPILFLLFGSLHTGLPGEAGAFSAQEYINILGAGRTYRMLLASFEYAVGSSLVAFVIGTFLAWLVQRTDVPGRSVIAFLSLFPLFMPLILEAVAWTLLLDPRAGLINRILISMHLSALVFNVNSMQGMIVVGGFVDVPLVFLWMWPAFAAMDPTLEEAAAMCRGRPLRVLSSITLPLLMPALAATFLINFVLAIEDVVVPIVVGLPAHISVLATNVYLAYTIVPVDVQAASIYGLMLLAITVALVLLYRRLTGRAERYAIIRGRSYRPSRTRLGPARLPLAGLAALILFVIVGLPVFILIWTSLSPYVQVPSWSGLSHLTSKWYVQLISDPMATRGLVNTAILGVTVGVAVTGLSAVIGWTVVRSRGRMRALLDLLAFSPIAVPGLVLGLCLVWFYLVVPIPVYDTLTILGIAFVTRFIPYGVRLVYASLSQLHVELEEAAYVCGSHWAKMMRSITLPLLGPALLVSSVYTVLRVFQELGSSLLLASFGNEPYSLVAYNLWEGGETGKTAAYGIVGMLVITALVIGAQAVTRRSMLLE